MGIATQLSLPAGWARNFQTQIDPAERLADLRQDSLDAKTEIRAALERLAEKHGIRMVEVDRSMGWADDGIADLVYDYERELEQQIEDQNPA